MPTAAEILAAAFAHHQAGRLPEAEQGYRRAVALDANHAETWNLLGVACTQQRKWPQAIDALRRAIAIHPSEALYHSNLGNAMLGAGQPEEAIAGYRQSLALDDSLPQTHFYLAYTLNQRGQRDEAIDQYRRAIALQPEFVDAHYNLGNALFAAGRRTEAISAYRRTIELSPNYAEAHYNLGIALREEGAWSEAIASYESAIAAQPALAEAHHNLAALLMDLGRRDEAVVHYRRALELRSNSAADHFSLGNALQESGQHAEAIACYQAALKLKPDYAMAAASLAHQMQQVCQWEGLRALAQRVVETVDAASALGESTGVSPFAFVTLPLHTTAEQQLRCARQWAARQFTTPQAPLHRSTSGRSRGKITIGYLSADFHYHATAMLVAELFERHDRQRFEIVGYSYGRTDDSALRRRIVAGLDRFVEVRELSHAAAARRIADDGVDILVDLKGYTQRARTEILALRPAPIQVNYLGYPGTMGADFIDYILVDKIIAPPEHRAFYSEQLVYLPGCYQVNDSRRAISQRAYSRAECGLPEKSFVFACFNNNYKITPEVFEVWMRLLRDVPHGVMWLLACNETATANLRREAAARGVASERLVFAPRWPLAEHLARHRLADLVLDTSPVNAHTTASEALWVGCPLLTIEGSSLISRVAGSLLYAVGLNELIAPSLQEYQRLAFELARDPDRLAALRTRLEIARGTAPLFDGTKFAAGLERAYEAMWATHAAGRPPRSFEVAR